MKSMKIFLFTPFFNAFNSEQIKSLKKAGELIVTEKPQPLAKIKPLFGERDEKILATDPDFFHWNFPNKYLGKIPQLKAICLKTSSFSWLDVDKAKTIDVPVVNNRGWATQAVVEWIIMTTIFLSRKMPVMIKDGWHKNFDKYCGVELKGKTAGILGLGKIGRKLAETCHSLGMKVCYWSKKSRDKRFSYSSIAGIITKSDFIFPVWANNQETQKLLPINLIKRVKPNTVWVDIYIAQDTHDRQILIQLAKTGKLFGYGFEAEANEFNKYPGNIAAIPESAWATTQSIARNTQQWVDNIINASKGNFRDRVN